MAKLSTEEINKICNSVDIIETISSYISLTQKGKNYFGVCPFHDDHSPSMSVSKEKQIYKCFSCGATGNVLKFVMDYENISFIEAIKKLSEKAGIDIKIDNNYNTNKNDNFKILYDIYEFSHKFYQNNLNTNEGIKAKEYLNNRKIDDDLIKTFGVGLSLKKRDLLIKMLIKKNYDIKDIQRTGLVTSNENGTVDIYYNRIMFPLYDLSGRVVGYSGRIYDEESTSKYINTKETEIFKKGELLYNYHRAKDECRMKNKVIVVEGFMDVIRLYASGIKNVVATMGTAVTKNQALLIKKMAKEIILLFDGDEAGAHATMSCSDELTKIGIIPKIVRLEENLDPDEYIKKYGKDKFLNKLNNPINIMDFKLDYLKQKRNMDNTVDVSNYINDVIIELGKIDDEILKEVTIQKVSKESGLEPQFIKDKIEKKENKVVNIKKIPEVNKKLSKYDKAENYLIYYMMKSKEVLELCIKKLPNLPRKEYRDLYRLLVSYYKQFNDINEANFITYVLDKEATYMDTIKLVNSYAIKDDYTINEIEDYIKTILDYNIDTEKERLEKLMAQATNSEDKLAIALKLYELKTGRDKYDK